MQNLELLQPGRTITGMSAILLPFNGDGSIDWPAFEAHVARTTAAGLTPAVNMDTGYVQLLGEADKLSVLEITASVTAGSFVAGVYVADGAGDPHDHAGYVNAAAPILERGGTPVVFPSHGLNALDEADWLNAMTMFGQDCGRFIGFELGDMFVPYGRIMSLDTYIGLLGVAECIGAKHSSLSRQPEWDRLRARDKHRPDFTVFTGNDLAIDMVMYGSDYLLGLSTFAPAEFALRDKLWATGDPNFFELNDVLQHLGNVTFRRPVPGYRHNAAQVFALRGWSSTSRTAAGALQRPRSDLPILQGILDQLDQLVDRIEA